MQRKAADQRQLGKLSVEGHDISLAASSIKLAAAPLSAIAFNTP